VHDQLHGRSDLQLRLGRLRGRPAGDLTTLTKPIGAENGRLVARSREVRGPAALAEELTRVYADPNLVGIRVTSAVDALGKTFRYRSAIDRRDGTSLEFFDAGEIDADGKISLLLVFAGPLPDASEAR
jgi:hypothetical protein